MGDEQLTEEQIAEFKECVSARGTYTPLPTPHVFRASGEDLVDDLARGDEHEPSDDDNYFDDDDEYDSQGAETVPSDDEDLDYLEDYLEEEMVPFHRVMEARGRGAEMVLLDLLMGLSTLLRTLQEMIDPVNVLR